MARREVALGRASQDALRVLGQQVKRARMERGWTVSDASDRLGINRRTWASVEAGSGGVAVGTVFNAAFLVGVELFGMDGAELALARRRGDDTLALLPDRVRKPARKDTDADFAF